MRLYGILFLSGLFGFAHASDTDVQFTGGVNSGTCDLTVYVNGIQSNVVNLGVVPRNSVDYVLDENYVALYARTFELVPDMSQQGCQSLSSDPIVKIRWRGGMDSSNGLVNLTGTALDALALFAGGSEGHAGFITEGVSADFTGSDFSDGAQFVVILAGLNDTGSFETRSSFSIEYN
ncbi:hypothetical protein IHA49_002672 [Salmonella enterica]|nr:hypothetical protein [Salmonella enterica]EGJ0496213.1 hypothetical protein [Salmonella enterica]EGL9362278.1 hypothetical protein [Salmonella enterica]EGL9530102.1 hypothetical protein [Salmonella enterica]EGL9745889.1 hypothetical protein [Salmonella enterica]